jgi:hypothetical protein
MMTTTILPIRNKKHKTQVTKTNSKILAAWESDFPKDDEEDSAMKKKRRRSSVTSAPLMLTPEQDEDEETTFGRSRGR